MRRSPVGRISTPNRSSASLTVERYRYVVVGLETQATTLELGTGRINSGTTLVSRIIIATGSVVPGRLADGRTGREVRFNTPQRSESGVDGVCKMPLGLGLVAECRFQDCSNFLFHRATVFGCPNSQSLLKSIFDVAHRDANHVETSNYNRQVCRRAMRTDAHALHGPMPDRIGAMAEFQSGLRRPRVGYFGPLKNLLWGVNPLLAAPALVGEGNEQGS